MHRAHAIDRLQAKLAELSDDQLEALADIAQAFSAGSVYDALPAAEKAEIDAAMDELDRGEGLPWETVRAELERKLESRDL